MIKVFIADDHIFIREGLKKILKKEVDIELIGETGKPEEIVEKLKECSCDILVLDISMPGMNGLEVLEQVKKTYPDMKVLILSMHPEMRYAARAVKLGASGYITKESAPNLLVDALRGVFYEGKYFSDELNERLSDKGGINKVLPLHENLSEREYQVLCLMAKGKTQSEIANDFDISVSTVNTYRSRILQKLQLDSNIELIHYAVVHNLTD